MATPKPTRVAVAERRARAIALRVAGRSWEQIKDELGYASRGAACTDVQRALTATLTDLAETADTHRALELERLDRLIRAATAVLEREHVTVSHGRIVRIGVPYVDADGEAQIAEGAGEALIDDGPVLAAIDRLLRLSESRRKLLGLDAPTTVDVQGPADVHITSINLTNLDTGGPS